MLGEKLQPILEEIELTLWEHEANTDERPHFPKESIRSATKIFSAVIFEHAYLKMALLGLPQETIERLTEELGNDIRNLIITYTGYDTRILVDEWMKKQ